MSKTITFNELRKVKDSLPSGSMAKIAEELGLEKETVKNYFGGTDYIDGKSVGLHIEPGPDGGIVLLDDIQILNTAYRILGEEYIKRL
jgi:AcrR family transcriptional regulator